MPRRSMLLASATIVPLLWAVFAPPAPAAAMCPISYGMHDDAKPNKLFLYFPTATDSAFPEFTVGTVPTSPARPFNAADLTSYTGTTAALRDAVKDVVVDDYCEFNVQVRQTTTAPSAAMFPRRNVVAVGSDTGDMFGVAQLIDTNDNTAADSARVWAGSYNGEAGPGGALNGANSTLPRWARSIGGTAAHEAGHNYGLRHIDDAASAAGEDAPNRHIMPAGGTLTGEDRAGYRRHFSDKTFSLLASNVGLSIQTMHNWDLVNPNAQTAHRLAMDFLSPSQTPILSWSYTGAQSPWNNPTVTSLGTQVFKGTTYFKHRILWSAGQNWNGGTAGQVPGGGTFHVGATFSGVDFDQPDAIIINKIQLQDAAGTALGLQPRLPGYDAGTMDTADGSLDVAFFNVGAQPLQLENVVTRDLPRALSIDAMMPGAEELTDFTGEPFSAWADSTRVLTRLTEPIRRGETLPIEVANLSQGRHIVEKVGAKDCDAADNQHGGPDTPGCAEGINVDLFPATSMYLTATVVDPNATHWDRKAERYVTGPLKTRIYLQVAGRHPDLDRNEVDDSIQIAKRPSLDRDRDGVVDRARLFQMR